MEFTRSSAAKFIDHTLLKATATAEDITKLCDEAKRYGFFSVCVNPLHVAHAAQLLANSDVVVCTVVGFPLGASSLENKAQETIMAVRDGAREIDMVLPIGPLLAGDLDTVTKDIAGVVQAAAPHPVKVILETCYLNHKQIQEACNISRRQGAAFVKTSTGFGTGGATIEHVKLMRTCVGPAMGVKASGGVRDLEGFRAMVKAGASRIGASAGIAIVEALPES